MGTGKPVALIAGAAGGIGKETARLLIQGGYHVIGLDRNETDIPGVESVRLDITDRKAVAGFTEELGRRSLKLDALVVSAAVHSAHPAEYLTDDLIDMVLDVNLAAHIKLVRDLLPILKNGGSVIGVSSIAACVGVPMSSLYSASKRGLEGFYESLRTELGYRGIRVSVIQPGNVNTGFNETGNTYTPVGNPGIDPRYRDVVESIDSGYGMKPEKVAGVIIRALRSGKPRFCHVVGMNARKAFWARKLLGRDLSIDLMGRFFGFR